MDKEKAIKIAKENGIERILDVYICKDYAEVDGKSGGDLICLRIYNDGTVREK